MLSGPWPSWRHPGTGLKLAWMDVLRAMHHALLAHGRAVQMLREHCAREPIIGWASLGEVKFPVSSLPEDIEAARTRTMAADSRDLWNNTLFSDPICLGHYPEDALRVWGRDFPKFSQADMDLIHQKTDFYGLNVYRGQPVSAARTPMLPMCSASPAIPSMPIHGRSTRPLFTGVPSSFTSIPITDSYYRERLCRSGLGSRRWGGARSAANRFQSPISYRAGAGDRR